ncbi:MAG: hypothetical protein GY808_11970, partial [Gammaproteobacteria bacterium]|nr:hypothetical protein [Gammaproteobacteria bacterium]
VTLAWTYSPEGMVLLGEEGPVTNLDCGNNATYDWSTGLIFKNGNYFDPRTGVWLVGGGLVIWNSWQPHSGKRKTRKNKRLLLLILVGIMMALTIVGCAGSEQSSTPTPCPPGPYDPPSLLDDPPNTHVLTINIVELDGVHANWKEQVDFADEIFEQADISIRADYKGNLGLRESQSILIDRELDVSEPIEYEECRLITEGGSLNDPNICLGDPYSPLLTPRYNDGRITAYYVSKFKNPLIQGRSYMPSVGHPAIGFVLAESSLRRTFAHELGHVLLNAPVHKNIPFLMAQSESAYNHPSTRLQNTLDGNILDKLTEIPTIQNNVSKYN